MSSVRLPPCRSRLSSLFPRFLVTEAAPRRQTDSRTILLHGISTPNQLSDILDELRVGPLESIHHDPSTNRAFLTFLDPHFAGKFASKLKRAMPEANVRHYIGEKPHKVTAEVVAAVGYRQSSRCIVINPIPTEMTEVSLKEEVERFGQVEKVEIIQKPEGTSFGRVHFYNIGSALVANVTLRMENSMKGAMIHASPERFDVDLKKSLRAIKQLRPERIPPSERNTVLLSDFASPVTLKKVQALVQNTAVTHSEVLQSLVSREHGKKIYLNFVRPEDAFLFVNAFNSQVPKPLPEGGKAVLAPPGLPEPSRIQIIRAVRLGASRTLGIFGITDWGRITLERIGEDFSRFGFIIDVTLVRSKNCAFIRFADIFHAMKAIDRIFISNRNFRRYVGTKINFVQEKQSDIRMIALSIDRIEEAQEERTNGAGAGQFQMVRDTVASIMAKRSIGEHSIEKHPFEVVVE